VNELLERSAVKVARSVLRGGRGSNPSSLPDQGLPGLKDSGRFHEILWVGITSILSYEFQYP